MGGGFLTPYNVVGDFVVVVVVVDGNLRIPKDAGVNAKEVEINKDETRNVSVTVTRILMNSSCGLKRKC